MSLVWALDPISSPIWYNFRNYGLSSLPNSWSCNGPFLRFFSVQNGNEMQNLRKLLNFAFEPAVIRVRHYHCQFRTPLSSGQLMHRNLKDVRCIVPLEAGSYIVISSNAEWAWKDFWREGCTKDIQSGVQTCLSKVYLANEKERLGHIGYNARYGMPDPLISIEGMQRAMHEG